MFAVSEIEAAAIRAVYERDGAFMAAMEVRRLFPGVRDNAEAFKCTRVIAGWSPAAATPPD